MALAPCLAKMIWPGSRVHEDVRRHTLGHAIGEEVAGSIFYIAEISVTLGGIPIPVEESRRKEQFIVGQFVEIGAGQQIPFKGFVQEVCQLKHVQHTGFRSRNDPLEAFMNGTHSTAFMAKPSKPDPVPLRVFAEYCPATPSIDIVQPGTSRGVTGSQPRVRHYAPSDSNKLGVVYPLGSVTIFPLIG